MSPKGKLWMWIFAGACGLSVLAEVFITERHGAFAWEAWPGFYGLYGFLSCAILVLISKHILRPAVMFDDDESESGGGTEAE